VSGTRGRSVVSMLFAQAFAFGLMLALLVIPANSLFLAAYGAKWLPATYIAIAVVGTAVSALIAREARRTRLVRVATVSLLALAVLYALSWAILVSGGVWVSAVLLVLFPIALQIGFVFIGAQAGRLLDVRRLKAGFPRVVTGFSLGFLLGGLLGIPLLALLGSTEDLLLATTLAQLAFVALLIATERRFPEVHAAPAGGLPKLARPQLRTVLASGVVLVLLLYQVLSSMGSETLDYLLMNRARSHYTGSELTRFLSVYTVAVNVVDLLFLALLAGPLMRRFGLRLGLVLNPAVVTVLLVVMGLVAGGAGTAAFGLLVLAATAQIADLALTDGMTRTSVNSSFQVVPMEDRLSVQAVVEGIGVPVAIGVTGVVLLAVNLAGLGVGPVIGFALALGVLWTLAALAAYRSYKRALADEMRRGTLVPAAQIDAGDAALQALLASDDTRDVRLGLDLLSGGSALTAADVVRQAAAHPDPEVRARAFLQLADAGDAGAAEAAASLARELARSPDPADRRAAAVALGGRRAAGAHDLLVALLDDAEAEVRAAALDSVMAEDAAEPEIVGRVVSAVEDRATTGNATAAVTRLGDAAAPLLAEALAQDGGTTRRRLVRAAAASAPLHGFAVIAPAVEDPDRAVVLSALEALGDVPAGDAVPPGVLDRVLDDASAHAARSCSARAALAGANGSLQRALDDEIELCRRLVVAVLVLRHGGRVRDAVRTVDRAEGQRRALGIEALDVLLTRDEAAIALPLVSRDLGSGEPAARATPAGSSTRAAGEWIDDIAGDPERVWRSSWLEACARHAARRESTEFHDRFRGQ
jgi:HEAT repeat protein